MQPHPLRLTSSSSSTTTIVSANHRAMPTAEKGARDDGSRIPSLRAQTWRRMGDGCQSGNVRSGGRDLAVDGSGAANYSNRRRIASSQYQNKNRTLIRDNVRRDLGLEHPKKGIPTDGPINRDRPAGHLHI